MQTYISLFSSAGVGCYGFKQQGFECIATNEIIERRLNIQKINRKCKYDSGYICGDITDPAILATLYQEIEKWKTIEHIKQVDVVIATPPCQGISVINHKKNQNDINRNSLVVKSVEIVQHIRPKIFLFENVQAFQKTFCITPEEKLARIGDYIRDTLGHDYIITGKVINFMNYGANSSRTRTLVIGVDKAYRNTFTPYDLFPAYRKEKTLRDVIGNGKFKALEWGEIDSEDFYHAFRTYDPKMQEWIHELKEGESAFDNPDPFKRPHKVVDGEIVENVKKNRDKYTRQKWDRFIQCIHTRNDQLAAQNTVHPVEDRVFSIRELMEMMNISREFRWIDKTVDELNVLPEEEKRRLYKENEINIRQCIGEAVPTIIMEQIAERIKKEFSRKQISPAEINKIIQQYELENRENIIQFIRENPEALELPELQRIVELCNAKRDENAAYYTNKFIVNEIMDILPDINKDEIRIIEPSVGAGSFIPFLIKRYEDLKSVTIDVVDIDEDSIETLRLLLDKIDIPDNITLNIHNADFLSFNNMEHYDLAIGNPPYSKLKELTTEVKFNILMNYNNQTKNLSEMFLEKCAKIADCTALVLNKTILSTGEFDKTRDWLRNVRIESIIDFGRYGFTGLSIETMCLVIRSEKRPDETFIHNLKYNFRINQKQSYITDREFPYFIIYRNAFFDKVEEKLRLGVFNVVRDRQITKKNLVDKPGPGYLRVLKARNIQDDGTIKDIEGYDSYVSLDYVKQCSIMKYVGDSSVYLTPNMTYNTRVIRNLRNYVPDGSVAILIPKEPMMLTDEQLRFFTTEEYREFYLIARNLSTQSINVDAKSVFFYGVLK